MFTVQQKKKHVYTSTIDIHDNYSTDFIRYILLNHIEA